MGNQTHTIYNYRLINHPQLHKSCLVRNNQFMKVQIITQSQEQVQQWQLSLTRSSLFKKSTLLLPELHEFQPEPYCGRAGVTTTIYYPAYPYIFKDQIQNRSRIMKNFAEQQLWYLLYILVNAAYDFNKLQTKVGDIRPSNIFISQKGEIKVANILSWPNYSTNYDQSLQKVVTFLSPEEFQLCCRGEKNTTNLLISESFSIGLTILQAALLNDCSILYDLNNQQFSIPKLQSIVTSFTDHKLFTSKGQTTYSPQFKQIVVGLCQTDPTCRLTSIQVFKRLQTFQKYIENLSPPSSWNSALKIERQKLNYFLDENIQRNSDYLSSKHNLRFQQTAIHKNMVNPSRELEISHFYVNYLQNQLSKKDMSNSYGNIYPVIGQIVKFQQRQQIKTTKDKKLFDITDEVLKKIDEQLIKSKLQFPN